MKLIVFHDKHGNHNRFFLNVPGSMDRWKMSSFRDYMSRGYEQSIKEGYLLEPANNLRQESLRHLIQFPELTYNPEVTFEQQGRCLSDDDDIQLSQQVNSVLMDRNPACDDPDSTRIDIEQRNQIAFAACQDEIVSAVDTLFDFETWKIVKQDGKRVHSLAELVDGFREVLDAKNQLRFLYRIALIIHSAPFENFSKILDGIQLRSGYEMWGNLALGYGGVCAEKTAALKFICDILSVPTRTVIGSDSLIPDNFEQIMKDYVDSHGAQKLPIDVYHHLIELEVAGTFYLVDVTSGNIPLTFLSGEAAENMIQHGFRGRMVYRVDRLNLCRVSNWVGDALLTLCEYHVPDLHLQYIFKQGLGLHITKHAYIGVYFDWGGETSARMQNYYATQARQRKFVYPRYIHEGNTASIPDEALRMMLEKTRDALRSQYSDKRYTGDFTFVIQPLKPHFWSLPRLSDSVKKCLN